jgi:ABC-type Mn2+/Zn2+ transport system ATPase subunit
MNHYHTVKTTPIISIKNLNVKFDQLNVIQDASINFYLRDQVALVGANGAGKTTLLRIILGLIKPESGIIHTKPNLSIGYLPQVLTLGDRLFPMTVNEVINQGLIAKKKFPRWMNKQDGKNIDLALKQFSIEHLANQTFGLLSLGQKQMILFARMMVQEPDIVFLDEPTSSLDVNRKDSLYDILANLKKKRVPYVIITHDLPSFSNHIQRVIYLEHKVLFDGSYAAFCENKIFSPFIHTHSHGDHHDH